MHHPWRNNNLYQIYQDDVRDEGHDEQQGGVSLVGGTGGKSVGILSGGAQVIPIFGETSREDISETELHKQVLEGRRQSHWSRIRTRANTIQRLRTGFFAGENEEEKPTKKSAWTDQQRAMTTNFLAGEKELRAQDLRTFFQGLFFSTGICMQKLAPWWRESSHESVREIQICRDWEGYGEQISQTTYPLSNMRDSSRRNMRNDSCGE